MGKTVDHEQRRQDAGAAIERLTAEAEGIRAALVGEPDALADAKCRVAEAERHVTACGDALGKAMNAGAETDALRRALADARSSLLDARSDQDRLVRDGRTRARRLDAIAADIDAWRRRAAQAEAALTRKPGRPKIGEQPLTPAEKMRRSRASKKQKIEDACTTLGAAASRLRARGDAELAEVAEEIDAARAVFAGGS
jgi:chromosome segregation ATPase